MRAIHDALAKALKQSPRRNTDRDWVNYDCPFCGYKDRFGVCVSKNRTSCFHCGEGPPLHRYLRSLGLLSLAPVAFAAKGAHHPAPNLSRPRESKEEASDVTPEGYKRLPASSEDLEGVHLGIWEYVIGRGVDLERHEVGVCDDDRILYHAVIPFREFGKMVYWQARRAVGESGVRMLNPEGEKGSCLFNHDGIPMGSHVAIGEGPFDAWALNIAEFKGTCALGTYFGDKALAKLKRFEPESVTVAYDPDALDAAVKQCDRLVRSGFQNVCLAEFDGLGDPDEKTWEENYSALVNATPFRGRDRVGLLARGSRRAAEKRSRARYRGISRGLRR